MGAKYRQETALQTPGYQGQLPPQKSEREDVGKQTPQDQSGVVVKEESTCWYRDRARHCWSLSKLDLGQKVHHPISQPTALPISGRRKLWNKRDCFYSNYVSVLAAFCLRVITFAISEKLSGCSICTACLPFPLTSPLFLSLSSPTTQQFLGFFFVCGKLSPYL